MSFRRSGAAAAVLRSFVFLKNVWIVTGLVLLLLTVIELLSGVIINTKLNVTTEAPDPRLAADSYHKAPWLEEFLEENHTIMARWQPYVHYRREPFAGSYITVDQEGHRRTIYPRVDPPGSAPLKVFIFGASTMWGTGARDEYTIASQVGKALSAAGIAADITNFAESGYVSMQEVITLLLELRKGNVPDLAVFYDGIGDTFAAFQSGKAGRPMNEYRRIREFNLLQETRRKDLNRLYLTSHLERSNTVRLLQAVARRINPNLEYRDKKKNVDADQSAGVEEEVANAWFSAMEIVGRLGDAYGFTAVAYWQPVIFTKDELTAYEKDEYEKEKHMEAFFDTTYAYIRRSSSRLVGRHFFDISNIFKDVKEPLYIDFAHVSEAANDVIAQRLADDIVQITSEQTGR